MQLATRILWVEGEDSVVESPRCIYGASPTGSPPHRVAVARSDRASSSALWSTLLVEGFLAEGVGSIVFEDQLQVRRAAWAAALTMSMPDDEIPARGALAEFVGLEFYPNGAWHAVGTAHSMVFHVRPGVLVGCYLDNSDRPSIGSIGDHAWNSPLANEQGMWTSEDRFAVCTGPLARWLSGMGVDRVTQLTHTAFIGLVRKARFEGVLSEEETALALVEVRS